MGPETTCEREHDFVLVLDGITEITTEIEDALYEAGCSDALLNLSFGRICLDFIRRAASLEEAILSAIEDVKNANIGASVIRVDSCNLVTQSDIARMTGRHRQHIHQYIKGDRGPGRFPLPVYDLAEGPPLWQWWEVSEWLWKNDLIDVKVVQEAREIAIINTSLEYQWQRRMAPTLAHEIFERIGSLFGEQCVSFTPISSVVHDAAKGYAAIKEKIAEGFTEVPKPPVSTAKFNLRMAA